MNAREKTHGREFHPGPRWLPWATGVVAAVVYLLTMQRQLFNDGIFFEHLMREGNLLYSHILYLPLARLIQIVVSVAAPVDGEQALRMVSAFAGGAGVALTFLIARDFFASVRMGLACAGLLGALVAYWFHSTATELHSLHAAYTTLLLLGLFRVLDGRRAGSIGNCLVLACGAALTPASHLSGICVGLPMVYVLFRAGAARWRYALAVGCGILAFGITYYLVSAGDEGFAEYATTHTRMQNVLWEETGRIPHLTKAFLAELFLYSAPAAALVPAGLRVLFRLAPKQAWFCVCWLVAWPIVAWPIEDRLFGAYYTPTLPVQALLAVVAVRAGFRTWRRALGFTCLGVLPLFVFVFSGRFQADHEMVGLSSLLVCAAVIFVMTGSRTAAPRGTWLLPMAAFLTSAPHIVNVARLDPYRDRLADVAAISKRAEEAAGRRALLIFLATNTTANHHWKHFFPGAYGDETRAFNPVELAYKFESGEVTSRRLERYRKTLLDALSSGRPVFVDGSRELVLRIVPPGSSTSSLIRFLTEMDRISIPVPSGLPGLSRLEPKR